MIDSKAVPLPPGFVALKVVRSSPEANEPHFHFKAKASEWNGLETGLHANVIPVDAFHQFANGRMDNMQIIVVRKGKIVDEGVIDFVAGPDDDCNYLQRLRFLEDLKLDRVRQLQARWFQDGDEVQVHCTPELLRENLLRILRSSTLQRTIIWMPAGDYRKPDVDAPPPSLEMAAGDAIQVGI